MRAVGWAVGAVVVLAVSLVVHAYVGAWSLVTTCAVSDTARSAPADASWQGWVCGGGRADLVEVPGAWVLLVSALLATALALVAARRGRDVVRRALGAVAALAVVPLATGVALALPPDECSAEQRRERPASACDTRREG